MFYIFLCILFNAVLFVIFKSFTKYNISTFQAIVFNYITAFLLALSQSKVDYNLTDIPNQKWFLGAVILGFLFISIFNVIGKTTQKLGISVVAVAGKMSLIIPIIFGIVVYNESAGYLKIIGIVLALLAVYLVTKKDDIKIEKQYLYLPIILFFGSGILDTLIKYIEENYVTKAELELYTGSIFLIAFIIGFSIILGMLITKKTKLAFKNIIAGIVLGIPNYYSIYFLLKGLQTEGLESSTVFTINNIGILLLSTIIGILFFKEKLSKLNYFGVFLSIVAIILVLVV